jgi:hypothetical protein
MGIYTVYEGSHSNKYINVPGTEFVQYSTITGGTVITVPHSTVPQYYSARDRAVRLRRTQ